MLHREIARRIILNPDLLRRAREKVAARLEEGGGQRDYALAWRALLAGSPAELVAVLTDPGEAATALRQTTPFAYVVDAVTRNRLWHEARAQWETSRAAQ